MSHPPLTPEQIEFFADQNRIAAERASKRTIRRALAGYVILGLGVLGMYWNGQHVSTSERSAIVSSGSAVIVDGCNRDFRTNNRIRSILNHAQESVALQYKQGKISAGQYGLAQDFYNRELALTPLPDCRDAADVLTSNPDAEIKAPVPLHAPDPVPSSHLNGYPG